MARQNLWFATSASPPRNDEQFDPQGRRKPPFFFAAL